MLCVAISRNYAMPKTQIFRIKTISDTDEQPDADDERYDDAPVEATGTRLQTGFARKTATKARGVKRKATSPKRSEFGLS